MLQNSDPLKKRLKFQFWMPQRRNWQFWASGIGKQFSTTSKDSHEEEMFFFFGLVRTFSKNWCKMKPLHLLWGSRTESRNELNQTSYFILHTPHLSPNLTTLFCYNVSFSLSSTQYTGWSHIIRAWLGIVGKHRPIAYGTFFFLF